MQTSSYENYWFQGTFSKELNVYVWYKTILTELIHFEEMKIKTEQTPGKSVAREKCCAHPFYPGVNQFQHLNSCFLFAWKLLNLKCWNLILYCIFHKEADHLFMVVASFKLKSWPQRLMYMSFSCCAVFLWRDSSQF